MTVTLFPQLKPHWQAARILGRGTNRLCVADPNDAASCLKYELSPQERSPVGARERLRRALARLFPALGENATEWRAWKRLRMAHGESLREVFVDCRGLLDTRLGRALRCELLRDADGTPSRTLYWHIFDHTPYSADALCAEVERIEHWLLAHRVPLFDLNGGNFIVADAGGLPRLLCIDGKSILRGKEVLPFSRWSSRLMRRKIQRRAQRLRQRIRHALAEPRSAH